MKILLAQTSVVIDPSVQYQTIHGFGASDAWTVDFVGKYWDESVKNEIARKLFSSVLDLNGNSTGIGLSRWRFNIGAGSAEQGDSSNIELEERRAECFLNEDGTYDWSKQSGQQWFLNKAKDYNVENFVGFIISPPRFYTKNGRANSDNTDNYGPTNLKDDYYDDYAKFLSTVLNHFEAEGTHFSEISPINEPQYNWADGQEGCPWLNTEVTQLTKELNKTLVDSGLDTKILLSEAASHFDLYEDHGNADKGNQILKFFSSTQTEYIGNQSQLLQGLGGHSYYTDQNDSVISHVRQTLYSRSLEYGGIELYQTEYCLLSAEYDDYLKNTIFLAKMIYADLAIANVSVWDYWTALSREVYSQKNRFFLIRLIPSDGDYGDIKAGGTIVVNKNLWAMGNYSLFIRPGYKRIKTTGASDLSGLMCSSYIAPDTSRIVSVYVNWSDAVVNINQLFANLPEGVSVETIKPYITNSAYNLQAKPDIELGSNYYILPKSVTTMVIDLNKISSVKDVQDDNVIEIFSNPNNGIFHFRVNNLENAKYTINDLNGIMIHEGNIDLNAAEQVVDISDKPVGVYFLKVGNVVKKIIKK